MICKRCAKAADKKKPKLHRKCAESSRNSHCTCQHRVGAIIIVKSGATQTIEDNNGDGS